MFLEPQFIKLFGRRWKHWQFSELQFCTTNEIFPSNGQVSMPSSSLSSNLKHHCFVNLEFLGNKWEFQNYYPSKFMYRYNHWSRSNIAEGKCILVDPSFLCSNINQTEANINPPQLIGNLSPTVNGWYQNQLCILNKMSNSFD